MRWKASGLAEPVDLKSSNGRVRSSGSQSKRARHHVSPSFQTRVCSGLPSVKASEASAWLASWARPAATMVFTRSQFFVSIGSLPAARAASFASFAALVRQSSKSSTANLIGSPSIRLCAALPRSNLSSSSASKFGFNFGWLTHTCCGVSAKMIFRMEDDSDGTGQGSAW